MAELRVVRHTNRFEECCQFYGEVLGWPITKRWDEPSPGRIYGYGDSARIELMQSTQAIPLSGAYISVEVDNAKAMYDIMQMSGVAVTQPLAEQPWGHRNFGVEDPAGMTIVFFEVLV